MKIPVKVYEKVIYIYEAEFWSIPKEKSEVIVATESDNTYLVYTI